jgi:hypothetical protein
VNEPAKPITAQDVIAASRLSTAVLAELSDVQSETLRSIKAGRRKQPLDATLVPIADGLERHGQRLLYLAGCVRAMVGRKRTRNKRKKT